MSIELRWPSQIFRSERIEKISPDSPAVSDRQDRVPGFDTDKLRQSRVLMIGAGGLGGEVCSGLTRKGIGQLVIADPDLVEASNLNRQFFGRRDLWRPKAICLARNVAAQGFLGSRVTGHAVAFKQETAEPLADGIQVAVCGVDNNHTRAIASQFFRRRSLPVIFMATTPAADDGWVFIQEAVGPCVGCVFPRMSDARTYRQPCTPVGAVLDILRIVGGLVLRATDSILMNRRRDWNFRSLGLVGDLPDIVDTVKVRPGCRLCQSQEA